MQFTWSKYTPMIVNGFRLSLNIVGFVISLVILVTPNQFKVWTVVVVFLIVIIEETIGRWFFYEARKKIN